MQTIQDILFDIIGEQLSIKKSEISPDKNLADDLGADPLDAVEIIMRLEDRFNLHIPEEDAERLITVGDIVEYLNGKVLC